MRPVNGPDAFSGIEHKGAYPLFRFKFGLFKLQIGDQDLCHLPFGQSRADRQAVAGAVGPRAHVDDRPLPVYVVIEVPVMLVIYL